MQIRILSLSDESDGIKITLYIKRDAKSYKKSLKISDDDYSMLGCPGVDDEITESSYRALIRRAKKTGALDDALRILSYGDNNSAALKRKLSARGYDSHSIAATIEKLSESGYINEKDQAYRYVISLANRKKIGPKKIYPYLLSRGYKKQDIDDAIRLAVSKKEIDFQKIKDDLILKFRPADEDEERALMYKHGFSISEADL